MSLKAKLKRYFIKSYIGSASPDDMTPADWECLGAAIEFRFRLVDGLKDSVARGIISTQEFHDIIGGLVIRRQIEDEIQLYQQHIGELASGLEEEQIEREDFEDLIVIVTAAVLVFAFLHGATASVNDMTDAQRLLYDAALVILSAGDFRDLSDIEMAQINTAAAILTNPFFLNDGLSGEQLGILQEQIDIATESAGKLGQAIIDGELDEEARPGAMATRLALWVGTAMMVYNIGLTHRQDNPFLVWLYTPLKDHCEDCERLHGQVHTAEEWRESGWIPRGSRLACQGWRCGCGVYPSSGPSSGDF